MFPDNRFAQGAFQADFFLNGIARPIRYLNDGRGAIAENHAAGETWILAGRLWLQ
jgi:hypothetical protein